MLDEASSELSASFSKARNYTGAFKPFKKRKISEDIF